jgi:hypothetical protein
MQNDHQPQTMDLRMLIGAIAADPLLHAKWLNTFSYLEYIGFRKIVKSQKAEALSLGILSHALEEGRHAFFLKKLATKLGGPSFEFYLDETLLCQDEADAYFQNLDHQCEASFEGHPEAERQSLTYLYVTWLIECRAIEVYGLYKEAVAQTEIGAKLDGLLTEEATHLADVKAALAAKDKSFATRSKDLQMLEASLYSRFFKVLADSLGMTGGRLAAAV